MRRRVVLGGLVLRARRDGARARRRWRGEVRAGAVQGGVRSTRGRTTTRGWSQAHDAGRLCDREGARLARSRRPTRRTSSRTRRVPQIVAGLVREGYQMIFGCSFGMFENGVNGQLYNEVPGRPLRAGDRARRSRRTRPSTSARVRTRSTSRAWPRAPRARRADRLRRPVRHPRGRAARQRVRARRAGDASGREGQADLDERVVLAAEGDGCGAEPRSPPASTCIGQNVDSPSAGVVAESKGIPWVGYDSNAQKSAPKQWLTAATYNWGPYYVEARQGGDERHVEAGLLLRLDQGRLHGPRAVRPEGDGEDEGGDRGEAQGDGRRQVPRLPGAALRPERQAQGPAGQAAQAHRATCTRCSGSSRAWSGRSRRSCRPASRWGTLPRHRIERERRRLVRRLSAPAVRMRGITKRFPGVRRERRRHVRGGAPARCTRSSARTAPARRRSRTS